VAQNISVMSTQSLLFALVLWCYSSIVVSFCKRGEGLMDSIIHSEDAAVHWGSHASQIS
jgi:hypothetical protein